MSAPEATSGVPFTTPSVFREGPIPAPSASTPPIQQPKGDNGAPPAILNVTPPTKKEGFLKEFVLGILYLVFTGYAIYYGWMYGQQKGREYLLYLQSWGPWLRSWFVRPPPLRVA